MSPMQLRVHIMLKVIMKPGIEYTIRAEITSIGNDEPPGRVVDDFAFRVV